MNIQLLKISQLIHYNNTMIVGFNAKKIIFFTILHENRYIKKAIIPS